METILYDLENGVALLTLNRPAQKNAIDSVMRREIAEVVAAVQGDHAVRALIITGAGGAFCSGGDARGMQDTSPEAGHNRLTDLHTWVVPLLNLDRPVIAAVDGAAFGAGFGLALTADFVIATPRARFCASFMRLGLVPDFGMFYTLPRLVGRQRAKELTFSAREIDAEEAKRLDIVFEIQPVDRLVVRAKQLALSFANASPVALSIAKRALNVSMDSNLAAMLEMEASGQVVARATEYHRDSLSRFLNKQPPLFQWPRSE